MHSDPDDAKQALDALAIKRLSPRYDVRLSVRLQRADPELGLLEETTVTENMGPGGAKVLSMRAAQEGERFELLEVGGPLRARVEVIDVTTGDDGLTRLNLRFLNQRASIDVRERLRALGVLAHAGHVSIESELPADHPDGEAIRAAIEVAFDGAVGSWRVTVSLVAGFAVPWWLISVEGHGELFRLSFRPAEQNPEFVGSQLLEALRRRGLVE